MSQARPQTRRWRVAALICALICALIGALLAAALLWQDEPDQNQTQTRSAAPADAQTVQQGAYLARAGNCMACHTPARAPAN